MFEKATDVLIGVLAIAAIFAGMFFFTTRPDPIAELLEQYPATGEAPTDEELAELLERYAPEGDQRD